MRKFYHKINIIVLAVMLVLFIITAAVMSVVNQFNLRRVYEKNYTDRIVLINTLVAGMINSDDVEYFIDLMQKQDSAFKRRQTQFYHDRKELDNLQKKRAVEEQQANLLERIRTFHREMNTFKSDNYWHTVKELKKMKDISHSKYIYIFADTGVTDNDGTKLYTYIFDADDDSDMDSYRSAYDGLGTAFPVADFVENIYVTKKPMDEVMYYNDYYGELYYVCAPIFDNKDNVIAILGTDIGLEKMYRDMSRSSFYSRIVFLSFAALTVLIIFLLLRFFITKPLIVLTNTAQKIAEGNVYTSVPDRVLKHYSELGVLARAINDMSGVYQSMIKNTEEMFTAATIGKLDVRDDVSKYKGDIQKAIKQVNGTLDAITLYLNSIPESIFIMSRDFKMYFHNEQYVKHFGDMPAPEFIAQMFPAPQEKQPADILTELLKQPDNNIITWINDLCFSITLKEINLNGTIKNSVLVIAIDVTDLMKEKEKAQSASKAKSDFLSRMSHEVRTPMNAILGITEIQLQNEMLLPDTQEALGEIYNAGYLLLDIINDILDLSKIEANKLELIPVNYDVASLINDTVHLNIMRYDSKPIQFNLQVDENIPSTLFGDELRIKQILNNLLSNAFKYTDAGDVLLSISLEHAEQDGRITLVFHVIDTGQGMTADQVDKLFDEYARFNMEANRAIEGAGLGMSITKYLVHLMNGEILVESAPGKGSSFTVRLPQGTVAGSGVLGKGLAENLRQFRLGRASQMKKVVQIIREYMPYGRILVVDDVHTNLYVARGLLAPYGLSVETATSGFEAIEKIKEGINYDIIFMDHFMPRMDGIEATKILRNMGYTQPIVALTANALAGQAEIFLANGFDDFISKPIDTRQLNATLNKLVRDRYPRETIESARRLKDSIKRFTPSGSPAPSTDPELAENFIRDAEKSLPILETIHTNNYRRADDIQTFIVNVHAMKSALANIGEKELSGLAMKLEEAGRKRDIAVITGEIPAFLDSLRQAIEKIKPKDEDNEIPETDNDQAYLREKLLLIQTACAAYEEKDANAALSELRQKAWPHPVKELLASIAGHLLHSEFEEAANLAGDYLITPDTA